MSTVIKEPIKRALSMAEDVSEITSRSEVKLQALKLLIDRAKTKKANLLKVEDHAAKLIDSQITKWEKESQEHSLSSKTFGLKKLSLEPLKWRGADGWPQLALFRLDNPNFIFGARRYGFLERLDIEINHNTNTFPEAITDCYKDVLKRFKRYVFWRSFPFRECYIYLTTSYRGLIPETTKDKIKKVESQFTNYNHSKDIFILAEVEGWSFREQVYSRLNDPLPATK